MIGAGFMAQGLANQIVNSVPGMVIGGGVQPPTERAIDVVSHTRAWRRRTWRTTRARSRTRFEPGRPVVTEDAFLLCRSDQIDVIVEVTGSVEFGRASLSRRSGTASMWSR